MNAKFSMCFVGETCLPSNFCLGGGTNKENEVDGTGNKLLESHSLKSHFLNRIR